MKVYLYHELVGWYAKDKTWTMHFPKAKEFKSAAEADAAGKALVPDRQYLVFTTNGKKGKW